MMKVLGESDGSHWEGPPVLLRQGLPPEGAVSSGLTGEHHGACPSGSLAFRRENGMSFAEMGFLSFSIPCAPNNIGMVI